MCAVGSGVAASGPAATFSNVNFLLHGTALPLYDVGNIGVGVVNKSCTIDTSTKPSWASGSLSTGAFGNHSNNARVPELGSNFKLGTAFCIEAMVYCSSAGARIFDTRVDVDDTNGWVFGVQATTLYPFLTFGGTTYGTSSPTGSVTANTWTHVRITYDGTTVRVFVAGVITWSGAASININNGTHLCIANNSGTASIGFAAQFLSEMRIVKGEAVTTSAFTPPTAAWPDSGAVISLQTNVTYSNVVLRQTYDSNVTDQSTFARTMTANGGAASSSGTSKFGGASLLLDGTGDYLSTPDSTDFDMGSGDYQFQAWVYRNGAKGTANSFVLSCYVDSSHGYLLGMESSTSILRWNATGDGIDVTCVSALANTTWTHIAVGKKSGFLYIFLNGELQQFAADSQTTDCNGTMFVGRLNNSITDRDWLGSIDDLQLVKGECQLTKSFLVPTAALPTS